MIYIRIMSRHYCYDDQTIHLMISKVFAPPVIIATLVKQMQKRTFISNKILILIF